MSAAASLWTRPEWSDVVMVAMVAVVVAVVVVVVVGGWRAGG